MSRLKRLFAAPSPWRAPGAATFFGALVLALALAAASLLAGPAAATQRGLAIVHSLESPPYFDIDEQGRATGLLARYWRRWAEKTGTQVFFTGARSQEEAVAMLLAGRADVCAGLAPDPALEERLSFSRPILDLGLGLYAAVADGADLAALELDGATAGLVAGEPSTAFLAATFPGLSIRQYPDLDSLALALAEGQVRLAAGPVLLLRQRLEAATPRGFRLVRSFPGVQLRAAVRKGDEALLANLNSGIAALASGSDALDEGNAGGIFLGLGAAAWAALAVALLLSAPALGLLLARRRGRRADEQLRESRLLQEGLMAEMARHRKTRELLLSAIEQSPSGILIAYADKALPAIYNNKALRLLGLSAPLSELPHQAAPPFLVYTPAGGLLGHEDLPLALAMNQGTVTENAEFRLVLADGTERWISANAAPVRAADGSIAAAVLVFHDISEQRENERELARFKFFLDSGVEEVYLIRPDGTVAYVNEAVARSLGRARADLVGASLSVIDPAYPKEAFRSLLGRVREGAQTFETVQVSAGGARMVKEIKAFYMRFGEDEFLCAFGRDITARKNLLQELESTRALFEAALDQSPTGIVIAEAASGRTSIVNRAAERVLGTQPGELLDVPVAAYQPGWRFLDGEGAVIAPQDAPFARALLGQSTEGMEVRFQPEGGQERWLLCSAAPIRSAEGEVVAGVLTMADITARKMMEKQLLFKALHDGLTGLPNRVLCLERIQQAAEDAQRRGGLFAVAFIDLDHFKLMNDSLGHSFGDRVLIEAARRLVRGVRGQDTVCRFGGDEFVLIVEGVAGAEGAQELIRSALERLREPFLVDGQEVRLTASVGVVVGPTADSPRAESILQNADVAMHRAKDAGRDRMRMFHPGMLRRAVELMALDADMRRALDQDEFLVYYQPIYSMSGTELRGLEALVRWKSPLRGLVGPDLFIPHAEESGLIVPLGERVLRRACAAMASWRAEYPDARRVPLSVNLSARQFTQPDLVEVVRQALNESGLPPAMLKIEITESALMADPEGALSSMRRLKALGVSLAIDDFGTGYSSLSYLQRFPVDILKIDRSFVRDLPREDSDSRELVRAIVALGRSLRLTVVAEGVESREQLDILAELGCEAVQGFLFSPPVPPVGVEPLLGRRLATGRRADDFSAARAGQHGQEGQGAHSADSSAQADDLGSPQEYPRQ